MVYIHTMNLYFVPLTLKSDVKHWKLRKICNQKKRGLSHEKKTSEVAIFTWKMRPVLNRMKKYFRFFFWVMAVCIYNQWWHTWLFNCVTYQNRPKLAKFTGNMRNKLKRMKNQFSDYSDFFFELRSFLTQNMVNFRWILTITE